MVLPRISETTPIDRGHMQLGTWQEIFVFEYGHAPPTRHLAMAVIGKI